MPAERPSTALRPLLLYRLGWSYRNAGVAALASAAMIVVPAAIAYGRRDDLSWGGDWPLLATGLAGLFILSIDYTTSYQDALRAVVQFNERAEEDFERDHPTAP